MVFPINWTERAVVSYVSNIDYLQKMWSETEVNNFEDKVKKTACCFRKPDLCRIFTQ